MISKYISGQIISVSNSLDPDQDRHFVGPGLDPNCLQRSAADVEIHRWQAKSLSRNLGSIMCTFFYMDLNTRKPDKQ